MTGEFKDNEDQETQDQTEFTLEEAEEYGAFLEDAISEDDAIESSE